MRAKQIELGDHGVVGDVQDRVLIALIWKGSAGDAEVLGDLIRAVVDIAGRDDLVSGMVERGHRHVELVTVLGLHVLADDRQATLAQISDGRHHRAVRPAGLRRTDPGRGTPDRRP
jgi:hypothetical protein